MHLYKAKRNENKACDLKKNTEIRNKGMMSLGLRKFALGGRRRGRG